MKQSNYSFSLFNHLLLAMAWIITTFSLSIWVMNVHAANWELQTQLPSSNSLKGVWGSSSNNVFAVGDSGTVLHYDGNQWLTLDSGTSVTLYNVWGNTADDVFAVGSNGTILHYDGTQWIAMNSNTSSTLIDIWGHSSSQVFAVGESGTILSYDGNQWTTMNSNTSTSLWGIWGHSNTDVFAGGQNGTILHYDGNQWTSMNSNTVAWFNSIWGNTNDNLFAVGDDNAIVHYEGSQWNTMNSNAYFMIYGIWGSSTHNVVAVGSEGTIIQYDGNQWTTMNSGISTWLWDIWGSANGDLFVVGADGTILHYQNDTIIGCIDVNATNYNLEATVDDGNCAYNTAPVLNEIGNQSISQSDTLSFTATAFDAENDSLEFGLTNAPIGAYLDSNTGEFSWTPPEIGTFELTVAVTEYGTPSTPLSDAETILISVIEPVNPENSTTETTESTTESTEWTDDSYNYEDDYGYSTDNEETDDSYNYEDDYWYSTDNEGTDDSYNYEDDNWYSTTDGTDDLSSSENWTDSATETDDILPNDSEVVETENLATDDPNIALNNETNVDVLPDEVACKQSKTNNAQTDAINQKGCKKAQNNSTPQFNNIGNPSINITINLPETDGQPNQATSADFANLAETVSTDSTNHTLTVGLLGNGTITGEQIDCGLDCTGNYVQDKVVTLLAVPEPESRFIAWTGHCSGTELTTSVLMNSTVNCMAIFEQPQVLASTSESGAEAMLNLIKAGAGDGTVNTTLKGIDCGIDCDENYPTGTVVTLTATPEAGSYFSSWGGDCHGNSNPITVTIRATVICAALFDTIPQYTLTVSQSKNGTVTATEGLANGINCSSDCTETYYEGESVTLTATPTPEALFVGWKEAHCTDTVTMTANLNCTAIFEPLPNYAVILNTVGKGRIFNTAGMNCGTQCVSYLTGTEVTLTAIPDHNAHFSGWEGDCAEANSSYSFTLTADMSCTAIFTKQANGLQTITKMSKMKTPVLPALLDVVAFNAQGEMVSTDALFTGGISSNDDTFKLSVTQNRADWVDIRGQLLVDSQHTEQQIEISVVVVVKTSLAVESASLYFMLDETGNILPWDGNIANLATFQTIQSAPKQVEIPIYEGPFEAPGILDIYFGYRSVDGTVIYSPESLKVIINE